MTFLTKPKTCVGCSLFRNGKGFSALEGDGSSGLLVVAESLGRREELEGLPLRPDAPSGRVFQKAIDIGKLSRSSMTLTNTIRCKAESPYPREALDQCRQYLDEAIAQRKPEFILALGDVPLNELSVIGGSISSLRGYVLQSRYGLPMLASYHPSFLARGAHHLLGVLIHDVKRAHQYARNGVPERIKTNYVLSPTRADISKYLDRLRNDRQLPVAYDIETKGILGFVESEKWSEKEIIQIQFSSDVGEALVLPWESPWIEAALEILMTPNMKWGWNDRLSDRLALKRYVRIGGEQHDLMNAWAHLQPNFVSSKDETAGDKGVPAKLMSLQSCLSFYYPEEGPYKGMVQRVIDTVSQEFLENGGDKERLLEWIMGSTRVWDTLRFYGAKDADYTFRLGLKLFNALKKAGLW